MNCRQAEKLLGEYLDHRLKKQLSEALTQHLSSCPSCQEQLASLRAALEMLKTCPPVALPEGFIERTQAAVRKKAPLPKANPWRTARWLAPAFGLLMLALAAGWPYLHSREKGISTQQSFGHKATAPAASSPDALAEKTLPAPMPSPPPAAKLAPELREEPVNKAMVSKPMRSAVSKDAETDKQAITIRPSLKSLPAEREQAIATPGSVSEIRTDMPAKAKARAEMGAQAPLSGPPNGGVIAGGASPGGLYRDQSANPLANFTIKTKAADGAYDVLLRATPNNTGNNITVYPLSSQENASGLSGETPLSSAKAIVLRQSPAEAGEVWGMNISAPLVGDQTQPATGAASALGQGKDYRLIIPPRQFENAEISVAFSRVPAQTALQEISKKGGVIILAPASTKTPITLEVTQVPVDTVLRVVADQLSLHYEKQGVVRNLY